MKTKTKTEPWAQAKPYLMGAADAVQGAYNASAPGVQASSQAISGLVPSMVARYNAGDAGVNAARNYNVGVLSGQYLDGNPYLQQVVDATNNDVRNQSQAALGLKGLTGGSSYADIISRNLANSTSNLRYTDYNNERARMAGAASQAPGIAAADYLPVQAAIGTLDASLAPMRLATGYAGGVDGLFGRYGKTTQSQGAFGSLLNLAGQGLQAYATGGLG